MVELLAILAPILVVDILNPVLLGVMVFAAGASRPVANSTALLLGHTVAYFVAGILVSFGVDRLAAAITDIMQNPRTIDFVIGGIIGIVCLGWAVKALRSPPTRQDMPDWELTPAKCFGFGAVLNLIGVPFALPYFAAIDQILRADLSSNGSLTVLAIYNVAYALPFVVVPMAIAVMGERARPLLERVNAAMVKLGSRAFPWLIAVLGVWLLIDAGYYFITGKPLV